MKFKKIGIVKIEKTTKMKYDTNDSNKIFLVNYYYYYFLVSALLRDCSLCWDR